MGKYLAELIIPLSPALGWQQVQTNWRYEVWSLLYMLAHLALGSGAIFQRVLIEACLPKVHDVDVQMMPPTHLCSVASLMLSSQF
jgi:hypothetical protein